MGFVQAIKVIFVKIIRLPKQVSADGESSCSLREFKSSVHFLSFFFFNQSKDFCSEAVHCPRLETILHYKYPKIDNIRQYVNIFSENRQRLKALENRFYQSLLHMKAVTRIKRWLRYCQLLNVNDFIFLFSFYRHKHSFLKRLSTLTI